MTNEFKISLENIIQFAALLLQTISLFVLKPDIFNFQGETQLFAGGNIYNFILIFISIFFIYLGYIFRDKRFAIKWFIAFCAFGLFFIGSFFYYNSIVEEKTIVFSTNDSNPARFVKGDRFTVTIKDCAAELQKMNPDITELEIIKNCENITDISQLFKIWPEKQIRKNMLLINIWYCVLISLASVSLICGLQALKCARIKT